MTQEIHNKVKSLLGDEGRILSDNESLVTSGRLSSYKIVELASWLEKRYGIDFSAESFNIYDFETIETIKQLVEKRKTYG
jgi:acyl carrier protein